MDELVNSSNWTSCLSRPSGRVGQCVRSSGGSVDVMENVLVSDSFSFCFRFSYLPLNHVYLHRRRTRKRSKKTFPLKNNSLFFLHHDFCSRCLFFLLRHHQEIFVVVLYYILINNISKILCYFSIVVKIYSCFNATPFLRFPCRCGIFSVFLYSKKTCLKVNLLQLVSLLPFLIFVKTQNKTKTPAKKNKQ